MKFAVFYILRIVFYPITLLLSLIIFVRNWLYDKGVLKSVKPAVFTINVGNLNLGGTGKTPHVEYLVRLLADKYKTTILSRGYMRKTKGFVLANDSATAQSIGDEPMQYFTKFKDKINVVVCEDRVKGVDAIQSQVADNQLVILDDAFQHRRISPHLNLLLCDFNRPFYEDSLVPFGKLRDIKQSAKRADAVIVTKCPKEISSQQYKAINKGIKHYTLPETPVFFSRITYQSVAGYLPQNSFKANQAAFVVTGIAKPEIFMEYLAKQGFKVNDARSFPDHFSFSRKEMDEIITKAQKDKNYQILTTEKDMVKIKPLLSADELTHFFYVPIEIEFEDKSAFDTFIFKNMIN